MLKILTTIFGFLSGGVTQALADAYKAKQEAKTDAERIAAEERINRLNAIRDVQKAEAGSRFNAFFRGFLALGPGLYLFKIFAIDKIACPVLGLPASMCRTDPLSPELWTVVTAVIGFYFLYEGAVGVAKVVKRK